MSLNRSRLQYIKDPSHSSAPTRIIKPANDVLEDLNYNNLNFTNSKLLQFIKSNYNLLDIDQSFVFEKDYINYTHDQLCKISDYSLKPQQKFLAQFINPETNFLRTLVYHGLGSGKTCTSLVVGEAFKAYDKKTLYVVPKPLVEQYKQEILGFISELNKKNISCTANCVIDGNTESSKYLKSDTGSGIEKINSEIEKLNIEKTESADITEIANIEIKIEQLKLTLKKKLELQSSSIKQTFIIKTHDTFINELKSIADGKDLSEETRETQKLLSDDGLLVIDEIQRLVSESGIKYATLLNAIEQCNPKLRILLLSATPVYDNPFELALTMNLLQPRIKFPNNKREFYSLFIGEYNNEEKKCVSTSNTEGLTLKSCLINEDLLRYLCSGYVSYFKGGNPNAYPYKRVIYMKHRMQGQQFVKYCEVFKRDVSNDNTKVKDQIQDYLNDILIDVPNDEEPKGGGMYIRTREVSNIDLFINTDDGMGGKQSDDSILQNFKEKIGDKNKFQSLEQRLQHIRTLGISEKFYKIIELSITKTPVPDGEINKSGDGGNGPVFIFTNFKLYGVKALGILLEYCGLEKCTEFNLKKDSGPLKFFIWTGEENQEPASQFTNKVRKVFNSPENINGKLVKIILGTQAVMEGVSFMNVKQVHITDPWWNESRIEQIIARAVRFCSHKNLKPEEQWVDIYRHYSILPYTPNDEIQAILYEVKRNSNFKNFQNLSIEQTMFNTSNKKHAINNQFNLILKETAYDCDLNRNGNIIRLEECINTIDPITETYQIYYKNPSNLKEYLNIKIPTSTDTDSDSDSFTGKITYNDILTRKYSGPYINKEDPTTLHEANQKVIPEKVQTTEVPEPQLTVEDKQKIEKLGEDLHDFLEGSVVSPLLPVTIPIKKKPQNTQITILQPGSEELSSIYPPYNMNENIQCWNNNQNFEKILFDKDSLKIEEKEKKLRECIKKFSHVAPSLPVKSPSLPVKSPSLPVESPSLPVESPSPAGQETPDTPTETNEELAMKIIFSLGISPEMGKEQMSIHVKEIINKAKDEVDSEDNKIINIELKNKLSMLKI